MACENTTARGAAEKSSALGMGEKNYEVRFYQGDYADRQRQANEDACACYVEHHFNAASNPTAGYALVVTASNASAVSQAWGRWYARAVAREFGIPVGGDDGIKVGGFQGRGDGNLRLTTMPAILLEPLFASNPVHGEWIRSEAGQTRLARLLVESIRHFFPQAGRVGFSVGHKYRRSLPRDRGAAVAGGGVEADFAEQVLLKAKALLESAATSTPRRVRIEHNGCPVWETTVSDGADIHWEAISGLLSIRDGDGG